VMHPMQASRLTDVVTDQIKCAVTHAGSVVMQSRFVCNGKLTNQKADYRCGFIRAFRQAVMCEYLQGTSKFAST
jgi:hypothetical protein